MVGASSIDTAKRQVSILERVNDARKEFFFKNDRTPNTLYIGREDFYDMVRETQLWELRRGEEGTSYRGMKIYLVEVPHHLDVAIIETPKDQ